MRALLSIAVVAVAMSFVSGAHASGRYGPARLTIATAPHLAGVRFALDGVTYVTGPQGKVRIETTKGQHLLQILDTRVNAPGVRSTFARWEDNEYTAARPITIRRNTVVDAGFLQSVLVHFAFADRTGRPVVGRVSRLTLSNTLGSRISFVPSFPQWLRATGIARRYTGLEPTFVQYSIQQALVSGSNVVNKSQQRFYPALTRRVTASLLLYSARVSVHDFLFGTSTGNRLDLVYPGGTDVSYPLKGRTLFLSSLPRGTYGVQVHAGGYVPSVSLALSKNQVLDVKVVSYLDMLLLFLLVLGSVTVLILVPRPFLRLRLRAIGSGKRPTPDDLEPLTPLSAARKKLIHRYMPEPEASPPVATRLPTPRPRPTVVPASGKSVQRPARELPSRSLETAAESLRRGRQRVADAGGLPLRLRPAVRSQLRAEALKEERIELINVYMQDHTPTATETESPAPHAPRPETPPLVADEARNDAPAPTAPADDTPSPPPVRLAPVIALRAAPEVEEKPKPAPGPEEDAAPAAEESPAPPRKRAPARRKAAAATTDESAKPAARKSTTPPRRKRAAPADTKTTEQPARKRAPAKKTTTATSRKSATPTKPKSKAPAKQTSKVRTTTKKATTPATPTRRTRRTPAATAHEAPAADLEAGAATNGAAGNGDVAPHLSDLAAAVEALQEDLKKAATAPATKRRRKSTRSASR